MIIIVFLLVLSTTAADDDDGFDFCDDSDYRRLYRWACWNDDSRSGSFAGVSGGDSFVRHGPTTKSQGEDFERADDTGGAVQGGGFRGQSVGVFGGSRLKGNVGHLSGRGAGRFQSGVFHGSSIGMFGRSGHIGNIGMSFRPHWHTSANVGRIRGRSNMFPTFGPQGHTFANFGGLRERSNIFPVARHFFRHSFGRNNNGWNFNRGAGRFRNNNAFFFQGSRQHFGGPMGRFFNRRRDFFRRHLFRQNRGGNFGPIWNSFSKWQRPAPGFNFHRPIPKRRFIVPGPNTIHYRPIFERNNLRHFRPWHRNFGGFHFGRRNFNRRPWFGNRPNFNMNKRKGHFNSGFHSWRNNWFRDSPRFGKPNFFSSGGRRDRFFFDKGFRTTSNASSSFHRGLKHRQLPKPIIRPPQYFPGIWRKVSGFGNRSRWAKKTPY